MKARSRGVGWLALLASAAIARADGTPPVLTAKVLPPATVALIDPESGTSQGGAGGDVRVAIGDVISFRFRYLPVPDNYVHGVNGYLTEYIPANTEVVGVRLLDQNGLTMRVRRGGLSYDGCGGNCGPDFTLPSSTGNRSVPDGSLAQVVADTGVFYATDARTTRTPLDAFIRLTNGSVMNPEPVYAASIQTLLDTPSPIFAHNVWDLGQVQAYGVQGAASGNSGKGNTPFGYGSAVAGPQSFYRFEATPFAAAPTIRFDDTVGPWLRVRYPGSQIGSGVAATGPGVEARMGIAAAAFDRDVTPLAPLPWSAGGARTRAVRIALGETYVGEPGTAEIALRVRGIPLEPAPGQAADVNCAEMFGTDTTSSNVGARGKDNSWGFYLASPACAFLNLLFEVTVDRPLATGGDRLTYTINGKNLSTNPNGQNNVDVTLRYDSTRMAFVSATGGGVNSTCGASACVRWPRFVRLIPSAAYTFTASFDVGGVGKNSNAVFADYVSTELPGGYTTQATSVIRDLFVPTATLAPSAASAASPGTMAMSGSFANIGTGPGTVDSIRVELPAGFTVAPAQVVLGGSPLACAANCATSSPRFDVATSFARGESRTLTFTVAVPGGTATGLYDVTLVAVSSQSGGLSGQFEHFFEAIATIPVGQPRSPAPILTCPINMGDTIIRGTTSEPDGTVIRVFFNGIQRGTAVASGGQWTMSGFLATFGSLYGGLEVRASADGPSALESVLSTACASSSTPACRDGADNDGDGLADFPADPGCANPGDNDETDLSFECSDGVDNDTDNSTDWNGAPPDVSCSGPQDPTESGPAACGDGVDSDGDGLIDAADPGCTSASDPDEIEHPACSDGIDNDGDTFRDFPGDPGCHSGNDSSEIDVAQTPAVVAPRLLIVMDTSGSMNLTTCGTTLPGGDGSVECTGLDQSCLACNSAGCGNGVADDSRLFKVKRGITNVVSGFGEIEYGLMRYHQRATSFGCPTAALSGPSGGWQGAGAAPCGGGFAGGDLLVGFAPDAANDLLAYVDNRSNYSGTPPPGMDIELRGSGTTPVAGSLVSALAYMQATRTLDARGSCRPYRVILVTDGLETCGGDPVAAATALRSAGFLVHVIGFADATLKPNLDLIAAAGGTGQAIIADDATTLALAISQIISSSILVETCNNLDDNCNGLIDEGFVKYCNLAAAPPVPTPSLCSPVADPCNGVDDNCQNGVADEVRNACGTCGPAPAEICNGVDDDCDGFVDIIPPAVDVCAGCVPSAEICDGRDNDCDGRIDEDVSRACGAATPPCTLGTQMCIEQMTPQMMGTFGPCSGIGPSPELCDNIDNDCDGVIDMIARPCGTDEGECESGTELCTAGSFGGCTAVGGNPEVCNGLDDDCDTMIDEGDPGGGGACNDPSACGMGTIHCVMGRLVCQGATMSAPEVCNGRDDDCDGSIDEDIPDRGPCGMPLGGECEPGRDRCVNGSFMCVGYVGPQPEVCNCLDDNCDGSVDEPPVGGSLCGAGASCVDCQCAMPCGPGEFPCPLGKRCVNNFCVADPCAGVQCPPSADGTLNTCRMGRCVTVCSTVSCQSPLVCRPRDGACLPDNCHSFPERCSATQVCVGGSCVTDPCAGVSCPAEQFCRQGSCVASCAGVACAAGQVCQGGACVATGCAVTCSAGRVCEPATGRCIIDPCNSVSCDVGKTCDPATGACVNDPCSGVRCPGSQVCRMGECFTNSMPDAGMPGPDGDIKVLVTGDGGCACQAGRARGRDPSWLGLVVLLGLLWWRRPGRRS